MVDEYEEPDLEGVSYFPISNWKWDKEKPIVCTVEPISELRSSLGLTCRNQTGTILAVGKEFDSFIIDKDKIYFSGDIEDWNPEYVERNRR